MAKLTRVCRRCRTPQLLTDLQSTLEGNTKRYICTSICNPHWVRSNDTVVDTLVNESLTPEVVDILEGYLDNTVSSFDTKLNKEGQAEISKVISPKVDVLYQGLEEVISGSSTPHFITTCILGEAIDYELIKVIKNWCRVNAAHLHIFFKKRYLTDQEAVKVTQALLYKVLDNINFTLHISDDLMINNQCEVRASTNVHHTAISPTSKVKLLAKTDYFVVPHARQEIEITVNRSRETRSILASTGCINDLRKGHTQALAQVKAHSIKGGLIYRPLQENGYGLIPINFDGSGFYEYDKYYTEEEVKTGFADSIVLSDLHCSMIDREYLEVMKTDIASLRPFQVIAGDVMDNQSLCYHEQSRLGYHQARMNFTDELATTIGVINDIHNAYPDASFVALSSNHDQFLTKYFSNPNNFKSLSKQDTVVAYRTLAYMIETTELREGGVHYGNPMEYLYNPLIEEGWFKFRATERFDIDLNSHGDEYGVRNLGTTSNVKSIMGHVHTPSQKKGIIRVGTAQVPNPEYQTGMNNSAPALCVVHSNGKRQLLIKL